VNAEQWYRVTVHNQETEATHVVRVAACGGLTAAQIAVIVVFREVGWHHVWCHAVTDVEEVAA